MFIFESKRTSHLRSKVDNITNYKPSWKQSPTTNKMAQQFIEFFHDEANRLETFQSGPNTCTLTILSLSRNGFIHTGKTYACVFCFKCIKNVDDENDVVRRHLNINKHCKLFTSGLNTPVDIKKFRIDRNRYLRMRFEYKKASRGN